MSAWDMRILAEDVNVDFLDELADLDDGDIVEAVHDACVLAASDGRVTDDERLNGQAAATIAAIWAGAPYSNGDVVENYPFIRNLIGSGDEALNEAATTVLEHADTDDDLDVYLEALS